MPTNKCCVLECDSSKNITKHAFPKIDNDFQLWVERTGNPILNNMSKSDVLKKYAICRKHFDESCLSPGTKRLNYRSLPTLHLPINSLHLKSHNRPVTDKTQNLSTSTTSSGDQATILKLVSTTVDADLIALAMQKLTIGTADIVEVLSSCNIYLNQLNRSDLHQSANLINLNLIFDCLNTTNKDQIEQCCSMFKKLLSVLSSNQVFNKYSLSIERSLHHPDNIVKSTVLAEIEKLLINDNNIDSQLILICTIVDCLSNSDVSVSFKAVKCLKQLKCDEILASLQILTKLRTLMEINSEIRARIYDVLIHWSVSIDALALITSKGLFSSLISDIANQDIMMQMVTIQLLVSLGITDHGFDYLDSVGIIRGLYRSLNSSPEELSNPSVAILNPIILEFFVQIALIKPQLIYTSYPKVFVVIYEFMNENDDLLVNVAINSVKALATSWECKLSLDIPAPIPMIDQYQGIGELDIWSLFIQKLNDIVCGTKTECKASAIKAIVKIIQIEKEEIRSIPDAVSRVRIWSNMVSRTEKWYKQLTNDPFKNIVYKSCSLPFLDIQEAGFEMLLKLSEQPWGQTQINNCPSIMDILLKPHRNEDSSIIKTLKQQIVKTLLESVTLDKDLRLCILNFSRTHLKTNVNTTPSQPDIMVEDMPQ